MLDVLAIVSFISRTRGCFLRLHLTTSTCNPLRAAVAACPEEETQFALAGRNGIPIAFNSASACSSLFAVVTIVTFIPFWCSTLL